MADEEVILSVADEAITEGDEELGGVVSVSTEAVTEERATDGDLLLSFD